MTIRLLRLLARYPLASLGVALVAPVLALLAIVLPRAATSPASSARLGSPASTTPPAALVAPQEDPALLLERPWFDTLPEAPSDKFSAWLLFDDGIGLYRVGSSFRFQMDIVSHERKGEALTVVTLDDNKKKETRFSITSCSDKPPFDLCLTFAQAPLGPTKLYSFKDSNQAARRLPWIKGLDRAGSRVTLLGARR
jgi:hypothetical protein